MALMAVQTFPLSYRQVPADYLRCFVGRNNGLPLPPGRMNNGLRPGFLHCPGRFLQLRALLMAGQAHLPGRLCQQEGVITGVNGMTGRAFTLNKW